MRNIKKAEALQTIQSFAIFSQLVTNLGVEILNPKNESRDPENEAYKEQIEEFKVSLDRSIKSLEQLKDANLA